MIERDMLEIDSGCKKRLLSYRTHFDMIPVYCLIFMQTITRTDFKRIRKLNKLIIYTVLD